MPTTNETETPVTPEVTNCRNCDSTPDNCDCRNCPGCGGSRLPEDMCSNCETCTYNACCNCWNCTSCGNNFDGNSENACNRCERCTDCCSCAVCDACGERCRNLCGNCSDCENCCDCATRGQPVRTIHPPSEPTWHTAGKGEFKLNHSERYISVEIEVAEVGQNNHTVADVIERHGGAIVHDGSIQGRNTFEINTAPASGDKFVKQINEICGALATDKAKVNKSCGLHVHVDARDFNFYDVRKLVFLYEKIEEALYGIVAPSRKQSQYCRPCGPQFVKNLENNVVPKDNEKTLIKNVYGNEENIAYLKRNKYHSARYAALNVHSWVYRGSIECRMHQGTVSAKKIQAWGMLWAAILDYAFTHTEKQIKAIKGDSVSILLSIAPNDEIKEWIVERRRTFAAGVNENAGDV